MKALGLLTAAATVLVFAASCTYQKGEKGIEAQLPTNAEVDTVSYLIGVNFGYFLKMNKFAENLGELNMGLVKKGMKDYLAAEIKAGEVGYVEQFRVNPDMMTEYFTNYLDKKVAYLAEINLKASEKFFSENRMKDGVVVTESGLQYIIYDEGDDVKPGPKDTLWVHYTGSLLDGTVFDQSNHEGEPVRMNMRRVIKGWQEGLPLIGQGGHIQLFVPADLGYGERGNHNIEPNSTLLFDIELVKVGPYVEKPKDEKKK